MIVLLHGADQLGIRRRLDALKEEADGGTGMLATNLTEINGRTAKTGEILAAAMAVPFLAPKRMVIVGGLLDRFGYIDPTTGVPQPQFPPSMKPQDALFEGLAAGVPETTVLVFRGENLTKGNPMRAKLAKLPGAKDFPCKEPSSKELPGLIKEEARARGLDLGQRVVAVLAGLLDSDTLVMASELDKLVMYTRGRTVTVADVHAVCSAGRASKSYEFSDAVLDGHLRKAWEAQRILIDGGMSVDELLAYLLQVLRSVATAAELVEQRMGEAEIVRALKGSDWQAKRAITRARRLGSGGVRRMFETIVGIDRERKAGEINDSVAMELLISRLLAVAA